MADAYAAYQTVIEKIEQSEPGSLQPIVLRSARMHAPTATVELAGPHCPRDKVAWPCEDMTEIADALDISLRDLAPMVSYPTAPENARVVTDDGCTLTYNITAEAHYAHVLSDAEKRSITISAEHPEGGCAWEIQVFETDLDGPTVQLGIYCDAFASFQDVPDFYTAMSEVEPTTLFEVRGILDRIGAWDGTRRLR